MWASNLPSSVHDVEWPEPWSAQRWHTWSPRAGTTVAVWSDLVIIISSAATNLKVGAPIQREAPEFLLVVPLHFLALKQNLSLRRAISWWSVQFGQFLVRCSSTHGAPPCPAICKSGGAHAPVPHRVGATDYNGYDWQLNSLVLGRCTDLLASQSPCYCNEDVSYISGKHLAERPSRRGVSSNLVSPGPRRRPPPLRTISALWVKEASQ